MNNLQVLKWGLIAMVILNLGLMAFVWRSSHRAPAPMLREPDITRAFDFNTDQVKRFEESKRNHRERMQELQRNLTDASVEYYQTAVNAPEQADSLLANINTISNQIYQNNLSHFIDIREICTPEQRKDLNAFIANLIRRPPAPPPGARRPPHQ